MNDIPTSNHFQPSADRLCHNLGETAKLLGIGRTSLRRIIADGDLRPIRIRGKSMITRAEIERYLAACEAA